MGLSDRQEKILIGSLLGDAHLELNGKNVRLKVDHGLGQKEYLFWKFHEFREISSKPVMINNWHLRAGRIYKRWHFSTFSLPVFNDYWKLFYPQGRKVVPLLIAKFLNDPISLAVWYMDDGYKRNDCKALRLNTDCFSLKEQEILRSLLIKNFKVQSALHRKGKTWNIYIPSREVDKFCRILTPYILPSMRYKLPLAP